MSSLDDVFTYPLPDDSGPLRGKASSRSSPVHSFRSSFSGGSDGDLSLTNFVDYASPPWMRGRTLEPSIDRNSLCIYSGFQEAGASADSDNVQRNITGSPLSASPDEINASSIFEPFPAQPATTFNITEILLSSSRSADSLESVSVDGNTFANHRNTFEIHGIRRHEQYHAAAMHLPHIFFQRLLLYIDFQTYLSLRLSCRRWSASLSCVRPVRLPAIAQLPTEIVQQIYTYLSITDFDSARHTCRAWMVASLNRGLLENRLRSQGWWGAAQVDKGLNRKYWDGSEEWLLSKRVATECCFLPEWAGNGFNCWDTNDTPPWKLICTFDESFLRDAPNEDDDDSDVRFHVSTCGGFVLATKGRVIYVCSNIHQKNCGSDSLEIITSVVCPSRVQSVSMSMDITKNRFHVAALLEKRIGLVCELKNMAHWTKPSRGRSRLAGTYPPLWRANSSVQEPDRAVSASHEFKPFLYETRSYNDKKRPAPTTVPVEDGPFSLYPRVCLDGDVPLSVVVSSHQHHHYIVAFGSSAGISVHWIDGVTGKPLSRWLPLTTRSEVLNFSPVRHNVVSGRRGQIKLVSSMIYPLKDKGEVDSTPLLWGSDEWRIRHASTRQFYQVVPLSDGRHCLYMDPWSGMLCLGAQVQASSGTLGATKMQLDTKFVFEGPVRLDGLGTKRFIPAAGIYRVAEELKWGVRVVAAFRNQVYLFCVPVDWFPDGTGTSEEDKGAVRRVEGVMIGELDIEVVGLGIRSTSGGGLLVWGVGNGGAVGKKWAVGAPRGFDTEGLGREEDVDVVDVWEGEGEDRDLVMRDWRHSWDWREERKGRLRYGDGDGSDVLTEGEDGDVVMRDLDWDGDGDGDGVEVEVWEV